MKTYQDSLKETLDEFIEEFVIETKREVRNKFGGENIYHGIKPDSIEDILSFLTQAIDKHVELERERIIQLANNLKVNVNSNADTRTMAYKEYLLRSGHNSALKLLEDQIKKAKSYLGKGE